jgi:ribokinase
MFLVLGNATIDEAMPTAVWPAPGKTVVVGAPRRDLGGKGVNQALALSRTGAPVRLVAAVGRDSEGAWIEARLTAEGLAAGLLRVDFATDRSLIFVSDEGENAIASTVAAARSIPPEIARAETAALEAGRGWLLMQGNLSLETTAAALASARARGAATAFNPSPLQDGFAALLPLVDLLIVNESEAESLGGAGEPEAVAATLRGQGAGAAAVTLGARGSLFADATGLIRTPAHSARVVDTTGAGDAFAGVLMGALYHRRLAPAAALAAATAAAVLTVQRHGAGSAFPSRAEMDKIFAG